MSSYDITVTYTDGSTETWDYINKSEVREGVLWLYNRLPYQGGLELVAAVPLAGIRKWEAKP